MKQDITFTDAEKRIFLAAMGRERGICEKVDAETRDMNDPEAVNLVRVCDNIEKKVRAALWIEPAVTSPQRHENDHFADGGKKATQPDVPDTNVGDTISRQAAIDALGEEPEVWSGNDEYAQGLNNQWHYDVNALKAVPSAQPEQRWIPVMERLPEKEGWYITTVESEKTGKRRIENDLFAIDIALVHGHTPNKFCKDGHRQRTVAWMPLPEPYQKEGEAE